MWNLRLFPGLSLRSGRFNAQENERLMSKVNDFLAVTGIQSAFKLFHPQRFKGEEANIKKLKCQHRFHERIGVSSCSQVHSIRELYLTSFIHITSLFFSIVYSGQKSMLWNFSENWSHIFLTCSSWRNTKILASNLYTWEENVWWQQLQGQVRRG